MFLQSDSIFLIITVCIAFGLVACGNSPASSTSAAGESESTFTSSEQQQIQVEEELFDVVITLPADFVGETTQDELDADMNDHFHSATLNDNGSVTYAMSKRQHKELMAEIEKSIDEELTMLMEGEDLSSFTNIDHNKDFTTFTVTTTSTELNLPEALSVMNFYMYGGLYNVFAGNTPDNIHVDFVNSETGEIIESADSSDMGNTK